ncbi:MAG: hypothetical protein PVH88_06415 [Ignavibacteria bacterium]|jgi:hypothetical protein
MKKIIVISFFLVFSLNLSAESAEVHKTVTSATPEVYSDRLHRYFAADFSWHVYAIAVATNYEAYAKVEAHAANIPWSRTAYIDEDIYDRDEYSGTYRVNYGVNLSYRIEVKDSASVLEIYTLAEISW